MKYSVKSMHVRNSMLEYWCVLGDDTVLFYYLSHSQALSKLKELENERQ